MTLLFNYRVRNTQTKKKQMSKTPITQDIAKLLVSLRNKNEAKLSSLTPEELTSRLEDSQWPAYRQELAKKAIKNQNTGQGSPTRGWGAVFPRKGSERHALKHVCGDACFLSPETEGFPICASLPQGIQSRRDPGFHSEMCDPVRQGVQAAYNRARQYHHEELAKHAREILDSLS